MRSRRYHSTNVPLAYRRARQARRGHRSQDSVFLIRGPCMDSALLIHRLHFAFTVTYHYLFPAADHGTGAADRDPEDAGAQDQRRALRRGRPLLGQDFRHQLCDRRGDWNSHGISVRHQLVALLALRRRRDRADAGHGRLFRLLPGVDVSRTLSLWREAPEQRDALVFGVDGVPRLVDVGLLHRRHRRLDAASRGLRARRPMARCSSPASGS